MNRVEMYKELFKDNDRKAFLKACAENQLEALPEYKEVYGAAGYNKMTGEVTGDEIMRLKKKEILADLNINSIEDLIENFSAEFDFILSMING
jgi:hypothetical protein